VHSRRGARLISLAAASTVAVLYAVGIRPRMLTWGATREETVRPYPGNELVANPTDGATMATTLPAPPEIVWPWLRNNPRAAYRDVDRPVTVGMALVFV
jgi:hypothetical protein